MNDEQFHNDLRALLRRFGVTAQREMEQAVKSALEAGKLSGDETLTARARLTVAELELDLEIASDIKLA